MMKATMAMSNSNSPDKIRAIISHLQESGKGLKSSILSELSDLNNDEVKELRAAIGDINPEVVISVLDLLGEICENDATFDFDSFYRMLLTSKDASVRAAAISSLWECEKPSLIRRLIDMLKTDDSAEVRAAAAQALGKFAALAEQKVLGEEQRKEIAEALYQITDETRENQEVRKRAIEAVSPITAERTTEAIKNAYASGNPELKTSAIYAMGKNLDTRWLPILVAETKNSSPQIRYEAATAIGEMGDEAAVNTLIKLISDDDKEVQLATIHSLGAIGGKEAENVLKKCLTSPSEAIRDVAKQALDDIKSLSDLNIFNYNEG